MRQLHLPLDLTTPLNHICEERDRLVESERAKNTLKGYAHDWKMFQRWCEAYKREALPATPETVSLYLTHVVMQGRKITTAIRRTSGISYMHRQKGFPTPVNSNVWELISGAKRAKREQPLQVLPLRLEHVEAISKVLVKEGTREALRDRALITFGFASALRRGTLADLLISDVSIVKEGLSVRIRYEKQDQQGRGRSIGLPYGKVRATCPVLCLKDWYSHRGMTPGNLFTRIDGKSNYLHSITGTTVARRIRLSVAKIGLDPKLYCGHSLRAGFITEAGCRGVGEFLIASHTGHKCMEVLRKYFRHSDLFRTNVAAMVGM